MKNAEPFSPNSNIPAAPATLPSPHGSAPRWLGEEDVLCRRREWCGAALAEGTAARQGTEAERFVVNMRPKPADRPGATSTLPAPYSSGSTNQAPVPVSLDLPRPSHDESVNDILEEIFDTLAPTLVFVRWFSLEALVSSGVDLESCSLAAAVDGRTTLETMSRSGSRNRRQTISLAVDLFLAGVITISEGEAGADPNVEHAPAPAPPAAWPR